MKKLFFSLLLTSFFGLNSYSQYLFISGKLTDHYKQPLIGGNVILSDASTSVMIRGTTTNFMGEFKLSALSPGKYVIKISYLGFETLILKKELVNAPILLGTMVLKEKASSISAVTITGKLPPTELKGDTTQFNAESFKVNPDATAEELIKKMPGITVDQKGTVTAHGENVQKVTVDGRDFFGDDATATLRNLPSEVIDKIQVFKKLPRRRYSRHRCRKRPYVK